MHPAPTVATFHAAGDSSSYRWLNPALGRFAARIDVRCAVSDDARALAQRYLGGCYELVHNGVEVDRWRLAEPLKPDGPTVFFCGRHEPRKGLDVLLAAMASLPPTTRCWVAGSGPDTARLQAQYAGDPRIEWLGRVTDEEKIARMRGAVGVLRAVARRRVVRRRAHRGDGGPHADRGHRPARLPQRGPPRPSTPASCPGATPRRWPPACARC